MVVLTCIQYVRTPKLSILNKWVGIIVAVVLLTEVTTTLLKIKGISIAEVSAISMCLHNSLWLALLLYVLQFPKKTFWLIGVYLSYGLLRIATHKFTEGFPYDVFYSSAVVYLAIFLVVSFQRLRREELAFFQTNAFVLILVPLLFFLGFSFLFSFESNSITRVVVIGTYNLYQVVALLVNIVYYGVLNYYFYKERKSTAAPSSDFLSQRSDA